MENTINTLINKLQTLNGKAEIVSFDIKIKNKFDQIITITNNMDDEAY